MYLQASESKSEKNDYNDWNQQINPLRNECLPVVLLGPLLNQQLKV
jgi:hypothetical protein